LFCELNKNGSDWDLVYVDGGAEVMQHLKNYSVDVVVFDLGASGISGAQFLNEIGHDYPHIMRIVVSEPSEKENVTKFVTGAHQFVSKPCSAAKLRQDVARALALDKWLGNQQMRQMVAQIRTFPTIPSLYFEVIRELRAPDPSAQRVGEIIAKDMAMCTKMLQNLNSSFYSLPRQISDPTEAVNVLGFEMVKSLVLCIQVFSQFDKVKPYYFSIDKLWRHSTMVAQAARKIARFEKMDDVIGEEAYTAGLLHDIGRLVLVTNFAERYKKVQETARREQLPLWDVEKKEFGASHAEIGAYLLGVWGMPLSLSEAAAFHHFPMRHEGRGPGSLLLVHAADALVNERFDDNDGFVRSFVHDDYLNRLGLVGRTDLWRNVIADHPVPLTGSGKDKSVPSVSAVVAEKQNQQSRWKSWLRIGRN